MRTQALLTAIAFLGSSAVKAIPVRSDGHAIAARAIPAPEEMSAKNGSVVSAYYTGWAAHSKQWFLGDIPWDQITHLNYAFFYVTSEGVVETGDSEIDMYGEPADVVAAVNATLEKDKPKEEASTVPKLPAEDQVTFQYLPINSTGGDEGKGLSWFQNNTDIVGDTQILLSVGGYTWSKHFSAVCADAGKRKKFVDSSVELVKKYDLAGIDVDFEFPEETDKDNYVTLIKELREGLDKLESASPKLVTIAISAVPTKITAGLSKDLGQYLDYINVMAYDFMGYWQDFYQDSSPLKGPAGAPGSGESAIQALTEIGFDKSQIILGIPAYGKGFKKSGEKVLKESLKGSWDSEDAYTGIFDYSHIKQMLDDKASGWIHEYNKSTAASIAYKDDIVISFDCVHAVQDKKTYVDTEGLGGLFMWELSGDRDNKLIGIMNGATAPSSHGSSSSAGVPQPSAGIPKPSGSSPTTVAGGSIVPATTATVSSVVKAADPSGTAPVTPAVTGTTAQPAGSSDMPATEAAGVAGSRRCQGAQLEIHNNGVWVADGVAKCSETCASSDVGSYKCDAGKMVMCASVNTWSQSMGPCVTA